MSSFQILQRKLYHDQVILSPDKQNKTSELFAFIFKANVNSVLVDYRYRRLLELICIL